MNPSLLLSSIQLRVPDLARSVEFYVRKMGFVLATQSGGHAELATSRDTPPLLGLTENRAAPHPPRDAAGLFHAALLFPSRAALGAWLNFAAAQGVDFEGFSDHAVSEAIYLSDPDGNGLEFYADRPRAAWPYAANGEVAMTTRALNVRQLLADAAPPAELPLAGAHWGHLHLRVTNLARSAAFYCAELGLQITQSSYPGARFLAADGYHHHLGLNAWGNPQQPQPREAFGLVDATFARSGVGKENWLVDPDGIHVKVQPAWAQVGGGR